MLDDWHGYHGTNDSRRCKVSTTGGVYGYDYLVIATGYRNNFGVVPGLGPGGNAYTITTLDDAIHAGEGWRRFLDNPGDIVIGASQGAGCFGAAYEYLFNVSYRLRKAGLRKQVKLTYVSPEPFLGHFGIGGLPHGESLLSMFLKKENITAVLNTGMDRVEEGRLIRAAGNRPPWRSPSLGAQEPAQRHCWRCVPLSRGRRRCPGGPFGALRPQPPASVPRLVRSYLILAERPAGGARWPLTPSQRHRAS
jgi:hypothetical protein